MLMQKVDGEWTPWNGEVIDNTIYPLNIETLWPAEKLAAIGLHAPSEANVPDDKIAVEWRVEDVKGQPVRTPVLESKPEPRPSLEERVLAIESKLGMA